MIQNRRAYQLIDCKTHNRLLAHLVARCAQQTGD